MTHLVHAGRSGDLTTDSRRRLSRSILVLAAVIATLLALTPAALAAGGDYTFIACSNPDTGKANGGGVPSGFTNVHNDARWSLTASYSGCGTAGQPADSPNDGYDVSGIVLAAGMAGSYGVNTYSALQYQAPANVSLLGGTLWRTLATDSANTYGLLAVNQHAGNPADVYGLPRGDQGDWFVGGMNRGVPGSPFASAVGVQHVGDQFSVTMACRANATTCDLNGVHSIYRIHAAKLGLRDSADPQVSASSGTLLSDTTMRGDESVTLSATDVGSGLYRVRVLVDGALRLTRPVALNNGRCSDLNPANSDDHEFDSHVPCKLSASGTYTFDTTALADGTHTLTVQVEDAGGNTNTLSSRTVAISNHPPVNTVAPGWQDETVAGQPKPGMTLVALEGKWSGPDLGYAWAWKSCAADGSGCAMIPGSSSDRHIVTAGDVGRRLVAEQTASNPSDSLTRATALSGMVVSGVSGIVSPVLKPQPGAVAGSGLAHTFNGELAGVGGEGASACAGEQASLVVHGAKRGQLTLRYGQRRTVRVVLACASNGKRIRNATLEMVSRVGKMAPVALTRETDRDGVATITVGPGPSRALTFGYRMYADDANPRAQATLAVKVIAGAAIKASKKSVRNGKPVVLAGKLAGGYVPRRGVNLLVQWKDGKTWRPFGQVKTDRAGRYRYAYRFTRTTRAVRYQLRVAVANGQVDYPFAPGASKAVKVTVAP